MPSTLYDIGFKVGKAIAENRFRKTNRTYMFDINNGDNTSDGIDTPTSEFRNIALDSINYSMFDINILTSGSAVLFYDYLIQDVIKCTVSNNSSDIFRFVAAQNTDSRLYKFYISNAYVIFKNITFTIPDSFSPDITGYDVNIASFIYAEDSIVKFVNCKFEYANDNQYVSFVATTNSTIVYSNCETITPNVFTLTVTGNPNYPSIVINDGSNFGESCIIQDNTISRWISY